MGLTRHYLLAGIDPRWEPEFGNQQDGPRAHGPFPIFPIDTVNPVYGQFGEIVFNNRSDFDRETKFAGIYIQDQIDLLNDRLHLLLGGRFDYVKEKVLFITPTLNFKGSRSDTAFSWRAGALYELTDWLSPYVSVSTSFSPVSPFTTSTEGLDPVEGFQVKGGVKLSFTKVAMAVIPMSMRLPSLITIRYSRSFKSWVNLVSSGA